MIDYLVGSLQRLQCVHREGVAHVHTLPVAGIDVCHRGKGLVGRPERLIELGKSATDPFRMINSRADGFGSVALRTFTLSMAAIKPRNCATS